MLVGDSTVEEDGLPPGKNHCHDVEFILRSTNEIHEPPHNPVSLLTKSAVGWALQFTTWMYEFCVELPVQLPLEMVNVTL